MDRRLLIASTNTGKIAEVRELLGDLGLAIVAPQDIGIAFDVEETGDSFAANALLKARAWCAAAELPVLADDSGLEVDALQGAPGIYSARFGGPGLTDLDRNTLLLEKLAATHDAERSGRFRCVVALAEPSGGIWTTDGTCEGSILRAPRGEHGFGYDPVFLVAELGRSMAELTPAEKNRFSHRGRAVAAIRPNVERLFGKS